MSGQLLEFIEAKRAIVQGAGESKTMIDENPRALKKQRLVGLKRRVAELAASPAIITKEDLADG